MNFIINYVNSSGTPHRHRYYEIIICTKGEGVFHSEGFLSMISKGTICIVPPGTTHYVTSESNIERIYIYGELSLFFNLESPVVISDNAKGDGLSLVRMIYENRHSNSEYVSALLSAFIHFLLNNIRVDNRIHNTVKEIADKISGEFGNCHFSLAQILKESGYSEDYIRAQFKSITGKTPTEFLTTVRISHACHLIDIYKNSVSLYEIAEQCGYADYVYFSKQFKKITGVSPRGYTGI